MATVKKIDASYNLRMLEIVDSSPMRTMAYDLVFDLGPNIFDRSDLMPADQQYYGVFESEDLVGFGKMVHYKGYYAGTITPLCYFGNFFIHSDHQRKGYFTLLVRFLISEFNRLNDSAVGYLVFLKGNDPIGSFFKIKVKEVKDMPVIEHFCDFKTRTILITRKRKIKSSFKFRLSEENERTKIEAYFERSLKPRPFMPLHNGYHPECRYLIAEHNGEIMGVCELVDLEKYKRTRILNYKKGYKLVFHAVGFFQNILSYPKLPKKKEAFKELYINRIICNSGQNLLELDFVNWVNNYCCQQHYHLLHLGSFSNDPLLERIKGLFSLTTEAIVLSVHRAQSNGNFFTSKELNPDPFIDFKLL